MRILSCLLISLMLFANAASAAALCCDNMEEQKAEMSSSMPCHEAADHDDQQNIGDGHECKCQGCVQLSNVFDDYANPQTYLSDAPQFEVSQFSSLFPDALFHPPRNLS